MVSAVVLLAVFLTTEQHAQALAAINARGYSCKRVIVLPTLTKQTYRVYCGGYKFRVYTDDNKNPTGFDEIK